MCFIGFCVDDSNDIAASIRQRSQIKSLLVSMFHVITSCVCLEPFLLIINLNVMSSFTVFSSLIYVLRCKGITDLN